MEAVGFAARKARVHYRHGLRMLTYVTLDQANGGIIRDLSDKGVAIQAVAAPQLHQILRLRFELRHPSVRVDVHGEVAWATPSGQCGVRFVDLSPRTCRQINQWIFGSLLDLIPQDTGGTGSVFTSSIHPRSIVAQSTAARSLVSAAVEESDGLIVSAWPRPVIQLEPVIQPESKADPTFGRRLEDVAIPTAERAVTFDRRSSRGVSEEPQRHENRLSQPLSGRSVALLVDSLVVIAGLLLFSFVFLATARELPRWPVTVGSLAVAGVFVTTTYWALVSLFAGSSLGERVARLATHDLDDRTEGAGTRFR
jgi:PilZ domain-containing protein